MTLFVDSSAWYSAADRDDRRCERAQQVLSSGERLITSDHVLVECWFLVRHRLGRPAAERFWTGIRSGAADLEMVTRGDLDRAAGVAERFQDQDFSLVHRTSFAVMERLGIHRVATFDDDFAVFRFGPRLERAFAVVR